MGGQRCHPHPCQRGIGIRAMQLAVTVPVRHSLVRLTAGGWLEAVSSALPGHREPLLYWMERDLPLIVRRRSEFDPPGCLCLGLSLPPSRGKLRVPIAVLHAAASNIREPLLFEDIVISAPADWQQTLRDLIERLAAKGIRPQIYGAFAWQHMTGNNYVHAQSDVDLLVRFTSPLMFENFTHVVSGWESKHGKLADGELLFPNRDAVAWREINGTSRHVLVKSDIGARLVSRDELKRRMSFEPGFSA